MSGTSLVRNAKRGKAPLQLSSSQVQRIREFLERQSFTQSQWQDSYQSWVRGGTGWWALRSGGDTVLMALTWYQHIHRPGSKEWRPRRIISALLEASAQVLQTL